MKNNSKNKRGNTIGKLVDEQGKSQNRQSAGRDLVSTVNNDARIIDDNDTELSAARKCESGGGYQSSINHNLRNQQNSNNNSTQRSADRNHRHSGYSSNNAYIERLKHDQPESPEASTSARRQPRNYGRNSHHDENKKRQQAEQGAYQNADELIRSPPNNNNNHNGRNIHPSDDNDPEDHAAGGDLELNIANSLEKHRNVNRQAKSQPQNNNNNNNNNNNGNNQQQNNRDNNNNNDKTENFFQRAQHNPGKQVLSEHHHKGVSTGKMSTGYEKQNNNNSSCVPPKHSHLYNSAAQNNHNNRISLDNHNNHVQNRNNSNNNNNNGGGNNSRNPQSFADLNNNNNNTITNHSPLTSVSDYSDHQNGFGNNGQHQRSLLPHTDYANNGNNDNFRASRGFNGFVQNNNNNNSNRNDARTQQQLIEQQERLIQKQAEEEKLRLLIARDSDCRVPRKGFANLGNTCFANSVFHLLLLNPMVARTIFAQPLPKAPWEAAGFTTPDDWKNDPTVSADDQRRRRFAFEDHMKSEGVHQALCHLHRELFRHAQESNVDEKYGIRPSYMKNIFKNSFFDYHQHDAQEFLSELINLMPFLTKPPMVENFDKKLELLDKKYNRSAEKRQGARRRGREKDEKQQENTVIIDSDEEKREEKKKKAAAVDVDNDDESDDDDDQTLGEVVGHSENSKKNKNKKKNANNNNNSNSNNDDDPLEPFDFSPSDYYSRTSEFPTEKVQHENTDEVQGGVRNLLRGQSIITTTCTKCNHSTDQFDDWDVLQLPINVTSKDEVTTIPKLIHRLQNPTEDLEDYKCDNCGDRETPKKQKLRFRYLPEVLLIQLKRFAWEKFEVPQPRPSPPVAAPPVRKPVTVKKPPQKTTLPPPSNQPLIHNFALGVPKTQNINNNNNNQQQNEVVRVDEDNAPSPPAPKKKRETGNISKDDPIDTNSGSDDDAKKTNQNNSPIQIDDEDDDATQMYQDTKPIVANNENSDPSKKEEGNNNQVNEDAAPPQSPAGYWNADHAEKNVITVDSQTQQSSQTETEIDPDEKELKVDEGEESQKMKQEDSVIEIGDDGATVKEEVKQEEVRAPSQPKPVYSYRAIKKENPVLPCVFPQGGIAMTEQFEEPTQEEKLYYADNKNQVPQPNSKATPTFYACEYDFQAVVIHHGMTADSGHYFGGYRGPFNFKADYSVDNDDASEEEVARKCYEERMDTSHANTDDWRRLDDNSLRDLRETPAGANFQKYNVGKNMHSKFNMLLCLQRPVCSHSYLLRYQLRTKVLDTKEEVLEWEKRHRGRVMKTAKRFKMEGQWINQAGESGFDNWRNATIPDDDDE